MKAISRRIDRFCYKHPRFGVPHLIRYVVIITAAVYILSTMDESGRLLMLLHFSAPDILQGEIWRIITFAFVPFFGNTFRMFITLFFAYIIGTHLEQTWGQAKFSLFYLFGILSLSLTGLAFYGLAHLLGWGSLFFAHLFIRSDYLYYFILFAFATLFPHLQVRLFFIFPIRIWWFALFILGLMVHERMQIPTLLLLGSFAPLALLVPYFIFCGDALKRALGFGSAAQMKNVIHFKKAVKQVEQRQNSKVYTRKCTVCGKTDTEYPDLEFRYCSRCNGYFCYCIDHISNHTHVE